MSAHEVDLQRAQEGWSPVDGAQALVDAAREAARQGDLPEARMRLRAATRRDPNCVEAWLGLAWLARTARERERHLRRILTLEPGHAKARQELAKLQSTGRGSKEDRSGSEGKPLAGAPEAQPAGKGARLGIGLGLISASVVLIVAALWFTGGPLLGLDWKAEAGRWGLLGTATPAATPTPTLTPGEVAARFVPQLQAALDTESWSRALDLVATMQGVDPAGPETLRLALKTHVRFGQALVRDDQSEQAVAQFERARTLAPEDATARLWLGSARSYLKGRAALKSGDWDTAIQSFALVYQGLPSYSDVVARLVEAYRGRGQLALETGDWTLAIESLGQADSYMPGNPEVAALIGQAYRERGIVHEEGGQLQQARADLESALALLPGDPVAQEHYDRVMYRLFPPKRIEIDIAKQRLYAYEGETLVFKFVVSTGLPGRDTASGHYKVLDKIPMAYSEVWRLKMPNWLGIYYVGNIENGIHALPIRPDGTVMWAGLLGQKASYGCVILDNDDSQALYNWAEVGTKVDIHY